MNAIETSGPFIGATVAAILAGAAPFWVNLFASVFIVARVAVAYVVTSWLLSMTATRYSTVVLMSSSCLLNVSLSVDS